MTTETLALADFLLARIDEDEAACVKYPMEPGGIWSVDRVLAECEVKRRIVAMGVEFADLATRGDAADTERERGIVAAMACHALAAVYADHPDYRDEWGL